MRFAPSDRSEDTRAAQLLLAHDPELSESTPITTSPPAMVQGMPHVLYPAQVSTIWRAELWLNLAGAAQDKNGSLENGS